MKKEHGFGWLAGLVVLIGIGMLVGMLIFTEAIYAFGVFGAFVLFSVAALIFAWFYDRRPPKGYPDDSA